TTDTPAGEPRKFGGLPVAGWICVIGVFLGIVVDGMDYQLLNFTIPSLMEEWGMTTTAAGLLGSISLIGLGIGGVFGGWLADRIGRARLMRICLAYFSIFTFLIAFTHNFTQFAIVRFTGALGLGAIYMVGMSLVAEHVPAKNRGVYISLMSAAYSIGLICASLLSGWIIPLYGWRHLFIISIIPGAACFVVLLFVKESASYMASRTERLAQAKAAKEAKAARPRNEYVMLFSNPETRKTFIIWVFIAITLQFAYTGAQSWMPTYLTNEMGISLKSVSWYLAASYLATVIGKLLAGWLADHLGRRKTWLLGGISTAIALPLVVYYATPATLPVLLLIFGFFYGMDYAVNATFMNESFPTEFRATATGAAHNMGRAGSTFAPLMIGAVANGYSIGAGLALLAISSLICAFLGGFGMKERMYDPSAIEKQA
ncbi:MAG TPA: MFS transporter, partial [Syntrophomonas sp.]|nr:MFS transporter [Syntrophomonas sp.]